MKKQDNPFEWTTMLIICKRWVKPSEAMLLIFYNFKQLNVVADYKLKLNNYGNK